MKKKKFILYRRKREGKTNYKKRLGLLKSGSVRLVVRKSLRHVTVQLVEFHPDGDKTLLTASSKELGQYGWKGYTRNIPAGYLVGLLCGVKAKQQKISAAIFDQGLYAARKGTVLFSTLKGVVDGGLDVPHDPVIFPEEERLQGKHISADLAKQVEAVKAKIAQVK
jgi:large subunit ribosomal protein L18